MATYYVSATGNDSHTNTQAQSQSTPWKTIARVNTFLASSAHVAGDQILFQAGDRFYIRQDSLTTNSLIPAKSGTSSARTIFGRYGTGANPVVTGMVDLSGWTQESSTIYYATIPSGITLDAVSLDDNWQIPGRWPRTDWRTMTNASGSSGSSTWSVTDSELNGRPVVNGEAVFRSPYRWLINTYKISGQSGGTISGTKDPYYGSAVQNNFGFFVQKAKMTLSMTGALLGDWWQDTANNRLYVKFPANNPGAYTVRYSTAQQVVNTTGRAFLTFDGLDVEGSNWDAMLFTNCNNIRFRNLKVSKAARYGVRQESCTYMDYDNTEIEDAGTGGITNSFNGGRYSNYRNVRTLRTGVNAGTPDSNGDGKCNAIDAGAYDVLAERCQVREIGYLGISFAGDNVLVRHNLIDTFCTLKDDGSAIYTYNGEDWKGYPPHVNRKVHNNIIINGLGNSSGTTGTNKEVFGIYLDDASYNVEVYNNSIGYVNGSGIYYHNAPNGICYGNKILNTQNFSFSQLLIKDDNIRASILHRNMQFYANQLLCARTDKTLVNLISKNTDYTLIGVFSNNRYFRPYTSPTSNFFELNEWPNHNQVNISGWRTATGQDSAASGTVTHATQMSAGNPEVDFRLFYNDSLATISKDLGTTSYKDLNGQTWEGVVQIGPFESMLLIRSGTYTPPTEPVVQSYVVKGRKPRKT
jgi:hypothetical protein